jgi:site-specific recombinase XerD
LRRSESVGLDLSDYNVETGELTIRGAKGRKDRLAYATNGSACRSETGWLRVAVRADHYFATSTKAARSKSIA